MKHLCSDSGLQAVQDYDPCTKGIEVNCWSGKQGRRPQAEHRRVEWKWQKLEFREAETAGSCGVEEGTTQKKTSKCTDSLGLLLYTMTHMHRVKMHKVWQRATGRELWAEWFLELTFFFNHFQGFNLNLLFLVVCTLNPANLFHAHGSIHMLVISKTIF